MSLVFKSLDNATVVGAGLSVKWDVPREVTLQLVVTGSPNYQVNVEMSNDGVNWAPAIELQTPSIIGSTGEAFALYARANLVFLSGGTNPTVTAWLAAK
jgi:hypothetical protein